MNQTIAAIIFFVVWVGIMFFWADAKKTQPNLRYSDEGEPCKIPGHPLWNDC